LHSADPMAVDVLPMAAHQTERLPVKRLVPGVNGIFAPSGLALNLAPVSDPPRRAAGTLASPTEPIGQVDRLALGQDKPRRKALVV
jgi:hypothetical protein